MPGTAGIGRWLSILLGMARGVKLTVALNSYCMLRCKTCSTGSRPGGSTINPEKLRSMLFREHVYWLSVTGGEPFLSPEKLTRLIFLFPEASLLNIATSGMVPSTADIAARLPRDKLVVTVSLHGDRETHDRLTGVRGSFDRSIQTIKDLVERNIQVSAECLVYEDAEAPVKTVEALADAGLDVPVTVTLTHGGLLYGSKPSGPMLDNVSLEALRFVAEHNKRFPEMYSFYMAYIKGVEKIMRGGKPPPCVAGRKSFFVSADMRVHPCITLHETLPVRNGRVERKDYSWCRLCWTPCEAYPTIMRRMSFLRWVIWPPRM